MMPPPALAHTGRSRLRRADRFRGRCNFLMKRIRAPADRASVGRASRRRRSILDDLLLSLCGIAGVFLSLRWAMPALTDDPPPCAQPRGCVIQALEAVGCRRLDSWRSAASLGFCSVLPPSESNGPPGRSRGRRHERANPGHRGPPPRPAARRRRRSRQGSHPVPRRSWDDVLPNGRGRLEAPARPRLAPTRPPATGVR